MTNNHSDFHENLIELENIYLDLKLPSNICSPSVKQVKGRYKYYHYNCDNFNDAGWGCGYRTTQLICSWIRQQKLITNINESSVKVSNVPSILEMQKILADCGDKSHKFVGSKEWIGCFESSIIIDTLFDVPCKILHTSNHELLDRMQDLTIHFENFSSPIMMGGNIDNASKGILGIVSGDVNDKNDTYLIVADPHFKTLDNRGALKEELVNEEWISWRKINSYTKYDSSFYNFCLPQLKASKSN